MNAGQILYQLSYSPSSNMYNFLKLCWTFNGVEEILKGQNKDTDYLKLEW
jgi:hypothetical protein